MAYQCVYSGKECIGCMDCKNRGAITCDIYGTPIYDGDVYYEFYNNRVIADANMREFLTAMHHTADKIMTDEYDEPILDGEDYYCIYGDIISEENLIEYLKGWKQYASAN